MTAVAVIGAGAMGAALAVLHQRGGSSTALLGTRFDDASIDACSSGRPHPALEVALPPGIDCRRHGGWDDALGKAERIVLAVSSAGLADVVGEARASARPDAVWAVATKGWDKDTLRSPSGVVAGVAEGVGAARTTAMERVAVIAGPILAPELMADAPAAMVCASVNVDLARALAASLATGRLSVSVTDDVAGVEVGAAYKNVTAIAVGMCEGLGERLPESAYVHRFANARAAVFALGLRDMSRLAVAVGGRPETIMGLAGAGDLYVTCLGGRNGSLGRLIGAGQTPEDAQAAIGSTVEGVDNTASALALASGLGVELPTAERVNSVLSGELSPEEAITRVLSSAGAK